MKTIQISDIDKMLTKLPEKKLKEVRKYVVHLLEKEKKRKIFEKRVLNAEKEPGILFETIENAVKAVFDETED